MKELNVEQMAALQGGTDLGCKIIAATAIVGAIVAFFVPPVGGMMIAAALANADQCE
jgi:hypothetical protein